MDILTILRTFADRIAAWTLIGLGVLALLLGYIGTRGTAYVAEQIPYIISGGMIGLFLLGLGAVLLLSSDLRDQWRALLDIRDRLMETTEPTSPAAAEIATDDPFAVAASMPPLAQAGRRRTQAVR